MRRLIGLGSVFTPKTAAVAPLRLAQHGPPVCHRNLSESSRSAGPLLSLVAMQHQQRCFAKGVRPNKQTTVTSADEQQQDTPAPQPIETKTQPPAQQQQDEGKMKAFDVAIKRLDGMYGKGTVMKLGSRDAELRLDTKDVISTGSIALDLALGVGGLPRGRVVEIYGPEMSGKTTFALQVIANAQKGGDRCVFIDAEHALDPDYARRLGVDVNSLYISQPDSGEQALEIADTLVRSGSVSVLVVDSVAALVPKAEIEGQMGEMQIGLQARLMSQALRKLTGSIHKSRTLVIFINQIRQKVGILFGNPETTTGGTALKFYSSVRLEVRKINQIKKGDAIIGNQIRVKVAKNKLAPPFRQVDLEMEFGKGTSRTGELIDLAVQAGLVEKSGSWFSYKGEMIGQGKEKAKAFLESNPAVANTLETAIRQAANSGAPLRLTKEDESSAAAAGDDAEMAAEGTM